MTLSASPASTLITRVDLWSAAIYRRFPFAAERLFITVIHFTAFHALELRWLISMRDCRGCMEQAGAALPCVADRRLDWQHFNQFVEVHIGRNADRLRPSLEIARIHDAQSNSVSGEHGQPNRVDVRSIDAPIGHQVLDCNAVFSNPYARRCYDVEAEVNKDTPNSARANQGKPI